MIGPLAFAIVQVDHNERPTLAQGRLGVKHPVNMDGFYRDMADAREVAEYFAETRPDLRTYLISVIEEIKA